MSNKLKTAHLKYFREALSCVENHVRSTHGDICIFGKTDRVELSRMITANNKILESCQNVYQKLSEHFESQFLNDIDVEDFSEDDFKYLEYAFNLQLDELSFSYRRLSSLTTSELMLFNLNVEIGRVKMILQDITEIVRSLNAL